MISNFPLTSLEINDRLLMSYEQLVSLLGYETISGVKTYNGVYDDVQESFVSITEDPSGLILYVTDPIRFKLIDKMVYDNNLRVI